MAGDPKPNSLHTTALLCAMLWSLCVFGQTVRHRQERVQVDPAATEVTQAEAAIEKRDYATAERLLVAFVEGHPKDALAWYDLGFVYKATQRRPQAIEAYRKSIAAKPELYESNLNLGMLLAQDRQNNDEAAKQMKTAIALMPASTPSTQKARNWMALGEMEEQSHPEDAVAAFRKAAEFSPKDVEPHVMAAQVSASNKDIAGAEAEYKAALAINPQSKEALSGLTDLYHGTNREAEEISSLRQYLKGMPQDFNAHKRLGQLLLKSGDTEGAAAEFDAGLKQSPGDTALLHEIAAMFAAQKKFDLAAPRYAQLVKAKPDEGDYHYQYGVVLMQLYRFPEAQEQLIAALQRDPQLLDAYGELAVSASENKQYPLVVKVLDGRSKLAAETPATYFLRATAYDNLKAYPQAAENYHRFLEASKGAFPDREWQARHRLIAIEPEGGKKKK